MKQIFLLMLSSALSITVLAQKDEALLRELEYKWLIAEFKNDTSAISKMMDNAFMAVGLSKFFQNRKNWKESTTR